MTKSKYDYERYDYNSYTTGRKQDWGHDELNEENGWSCFEWDRGDYTETMEMKRPKHGKDWKQFRVYTSCGRYDDFDTKEEADTFISEAPSYYRDLKVSQVSPDTGEDVK
jgi:hypothetical protein